MSNALQANMSVFSDFDVVAYAGCQEDVMKPQKLKILIIEDDAKDMMLLSEFFSSRGHEIIKACDGNSAVEVMDGILLYDLILMNIDMLEHGCCNLIQSAREKEQKCGTSEKLIVLMSGRQNDWLKGECSSYVNGTVDKPLSFERLDSLLKQACILKELQNLDGTQKE